MSKVLVFGKNDYLPNYMHKKGSDMKQLISFNGSYVPETGARKEELDDHNRRGPNSYHGTDL
jgi:hypothetical protein